MSGEALACREHGNAFERADGFFYAGVRLRVGVRLSILALMLLNALFAKASAQIRIVSFNTLDKPVAAADGELLNTILGAIAEQSANGIAKRADIIALQEQTRRLVSGAIVDTSQHIAASLNNLHAVDSYRASLIGAGVDRVAVVYDSSSVELISAAGIDTMGTRPAQLARFRPIGYASPDAELYLYNMHLNASSAPSRASEVSSLLADSQSLADSLKASASQANIIYAGDFNFSSSNESGYTRLTDPGSAEAIDPLDLNSWPNSTVAEHMTQSTRTASGLPDDGVGGGLDDRFDLQLVTSDLMDGTGLSYIGPTVPGMSGLDHSYRAFGNDGVSWNSRINNVFDGRSQSAGVLNALHDFSDHLPVVADFQLPAVLQAIIDDVPRTLEKNELFELPVAISNAADVVHTNGADELDYTLSTSGNLFGSAVGTVAALATANVHLVGLDASTVGPKSGTITIQSESQAVENGILQFLIEYEVVAGRQGDYNGDGRANAADYTVWRDTLGQMVAKGSGADGNKNGKVDLPDLVVWKDAVAVATSAGTSLITVPEPDHAFLLVAGCGCLMFVRWRCVGGV